SRFANTPVAQNNVVGVQGYEDVEKTDTVGLGARVIGRPYHYFGNINTPTQASQSLAANNVAAICIPGKNIAQSLTTFELNQRAPTNNINVSDKLFNIGVTSSGSQSTKYLNACPAVDLAGYSVQHFNL